MMLNTLRKTTNDFFRSMMTARPFFNKMFYNLVALSTVLFTIPKHHREVVIMIMAPFPSIPDFLHGELIDPLRIHGVSLDGCPNTENILANNKPNLLVRRPPPHEKLYEIRIFRSIL